MNPKLRVLTQALHPDRKIALGSALILFLLLGAWRCLDAKGAELSLFRCWQGLAIMLLDAESWIRPNPAAFILWVSITMASTVLVALAALVLGWLLASIVDACLLIFGKAK